MTGFWSMLKRWFAMAPAQPVEMVTVEEWEIEEREHCRIYRGRFAIHGVHGQVLRRVPGRIIEWAGLPTDVYLRDPPDQLRHHAKGHCLQLVSTDGPWFKLHWEKPARDFKDSVAYVEQLLDEATRRKREMQRRLHTQRN